MGTKKTLPNLKVSSITDDMAAFLKHLLCKNLRDDRESFYWLSFCQTSPVLKGRLLNLTGLIITSYQSKSIYFGL